MIDRMADQVHPIDALLVIDMQNSFCHPRGIMYEALGAPLFEIDETVKATAAAVAAARAVRVPVVFTRHQYQSGHADFGPLFPQFGDLLRAEQGLLSRSWDVEIIEELEFSTHDLVVDKARLDAFYNTSLDTLLRSMNAARIAVAGVITNACVETSTRAAAMRDYDVTVLSDCTTSGQQQHCTMSLECLETYQIAAVRPFSADLLTAGGDR
jgi:ureidoacrylate peracid hydrolase